MAEVASSRLMQVDEEGQQNSVGKLPPQVSYELGQEPELRGTSSNDSKAWAVLKAAMKVKSSRAIGRFATTPAVDLAMLANADLCLEKLQILEIRTEQTLKGSFGRDIE